MGKQYSSTLKPSNETLQAVRDKYGAEFEEWWKDEFGYSFDKLTESEARYLAKARGQDTNSIRARIIAARPGRIVGMASGEGSGAPPSKGSSPSAQSLNINQTPAQAGVSTSGGPIPNNAQQRIGLSGGQTGSQAWDIGEKSPWNDFIYKYQNKYVDLKDTIKAIQETGQQIRDTYDSYRIISCRPASADFPLLPITTVARMSVRFSHAS